MSATDAMVRASLSSHVSESIDKSISCRDVYLVPVKARFVHQNDVPKVTTGVRTDR